MKKDIYITFINAQGVALAWIGAIIGPLFLIVGLEENKKIHLLVGGVFLIIVAISIVEGIKAYNSGSKSDFLASTVIPSILLVAGIIFSWFLST